jgi:glycosyltransferase involved in cell wall biosynthesis
MRDAPLQTLDSSPLVSVIVPAYNAERYVARALGSAVMQTYRNLEILVVDDGSTDRTPQIVAAMARRYPFIRPMRQRNAGVARARNLAIAEAKGVFVAPLDADDIWHPAKIEEQVAAMLKAPPRVGLVYCWSVSIDEHDRIRRFPPPNIKIPDPDGNVLGALFVSNFLGNGSSPLIRRELLDRVGGYDPTLRENGGDGCEDWKLYIALAEICDFVAIRKTLVGYREIDRKKSMSGDVSQMARAKDLIGDWISGRVPLIPARAMRWRDSKFEINATAKLRNQGRTASALRHLSRALLLDPAPVALLVPAAALRLCRRVAKPAARSNPRFQHAAAGAEGPAPHPLHHFIWSRRYAYLAKAMAA